MKIVQRISCICENKQLDTLISCIKKHPDSTNAVWLCTCYGYPSLEKHRKYATKYTEKTSTSEDLSKSRITAKMIATTAVFAEAIKMPTDTA